MQILSGVKVQGFPSTWCLGLTTSALTCCRDGMQLSTTSSVTDLGIVVDSRLSFNLHISNILAKATQRVGVFFRGFSSRHPELMRKAFITYIRPSLECNSNIWNPTKKYLIDKLENIQRRFTKRVPSPRAYLTQSD